MINSAFWFYCCCGAEWEGENIVEEVSMNIELTVLFHSSRVMLVNLCIVSEADGWCIWISEGLFCSWISGIRDYEVWWVVYLWQMLSCNLQGRYRVCWGSPWDECVYLEPKPSAQIYTPPSAGKGLQWERMRSCWVQGGKGGLGACFVTPVAVQKFWPALCWEEIGWELNGSPECFDLLFFWGFKCSF